MAEGVKKIAKKVLSCPSFKPSQYAEKTWDEKSDKHSEIQNEIKEFLTKQNFTCDSEYYLQSLTNKIKGTADVLCEKDSLIILFEVKSYPITKGTLVDAFQLLIYKELLKENEKGFEKSIYPILVYKGSNRNRDTIKVKIQGSEIKLPGGYVYLLLNDEISLRDLKMEKTSSSEYVINKDCRFCSNHECPVFKIISYSLSS